MIPQRAADLDGVLAEIEKQDHEVDALFASVSSEAAVWRPDATRWSVTGHLVHLGIVNEAYVGAIAECARRALDRGTHAPRSDGPYGHPWIARRFVGMMEPPVKRRMRTFRSMVPEPSVGPADALVGFRAHQRKLREVVEASRGLDLGKLRFGSPFLPILRFSLGTGFEVVLAHNRRHLWLMRELIGHDDFPS